MLSNRRRTYLNYLFENMTYLCTFSIIPGYGINSQVIEHSNPGSGNISVVDNVYHEIYSGNLFQYNKFMFISCSSPSSYISEDYFNIASERSMILPANFSLSISSTLGSQTLEESNGGYVDHVSKHEGTKLVMKGDSILLEDKATTILSFINSPYTVKYYYEFLINSLRATWAIFGINE